MYITKFSDYIHNLPSRAKVATALMCFLSIVSKTKQNQLSLYLIELRVCPHRGVATIDTELTNLDINQCDLEPGEEGKALDVFRGTHNCQPTTTVTWQIVKLVMIHLCLLCHQNSANEAIKAVLF